MTYIDEFIEYLSVIKKHSPNTIINYHNDLKEFGEFIQNDFLNITKENVYDYLKHLYERHL